MTNWEDKYKDLEVCKFTWYWHNLNKSSTKSQWEAIRVLRYVSMQDGYPVLVAYDICGNQTTVSESFPNGPKCLTPDDITTMNKIQVFAEDIFKNLNEDKPFTFVYDGKFYSIKEE